MSSRQKIFINTLQSCYYLISTLLSGSSGSNWSRACKINTNYVLVTAMSETISIFPFLGIERPFLISTNNVYIY